MKDLKQMQEWQPIETAPKDGTEILTYSKGFSPVITWREQGGWCNHQLVHWLFNDQDDSLAPFPTHWMPLPNPPKED